MPGPHLGLWLTPGMLAVPPPPTPWGADLPKESWMTCHGCCALGRRGPGHDMKKSATSLLPSPQDPADPPADSGTQADGGLS